MDTMIKQESMGRRIAKDGDEVDYLAYGEQDPHGVRGKVATNQRRRVRRQVREALRNWDGE